jgi:hypothetical protein
VPDGDPAAWSPNPELIKDVDKAMKAWWQGDYCDEPGVFYLANPDAPLTSVAADAAGESAGEDEVVVTDDDVVGLVVLTQTCDIRKTARKETFLHFARLVELDAVTAKEARDKKRPRYVHVPGRGDTSFADISLVVTVEKAVVAEWTRKQGCSNDDDRKDFREGVRRRWSRFAFPSDVDATLKPLADALKKDEGKDNQAGKAIDSLWEIRVLAVGGWYTPPVQLYLYFIVRPTHMPMPLPFDEVKAVVAGWMKNCPAKGDVGNIECEVVPIDELSAYDYSRSEELDTDALSV